MNKFMLAAQRSRLNQRGINMVDLMMWLVIAALLLAAALQGIGYYQKSSYLYSMKNDATHAAEASMAQVANDGKITDAAVSQGTADSAKTTNVDTVAESGASDADGFIIRSTSPSIEDQDVIFLSKQRGAWAPGVHVVPKGTVIAPDGVPSVEAPGTGENSGITSARGFTVPVGISQPVVDYFDALYAFSDSDSIAKMFGPEGNPDLYELEQEAINNALSVLTDDEYNLAMDIRTAANNDSSLVEKSHEVDAKQSVYEVAVMDNKSPEAIGDAKTALKSAVVSYINSAFAYVAD